MRTIQSLEVALTMTVEFVQQVRNTGKLFAIFCSLSFLVVRAHILSLPSGVDSSFDLALDVTTEIVDECSICRFSTCFETRNAFFYWLICWRLQDSFYVSRYLPGCRHQIFWTIFETVLLFAVFTNTMIIVSSCLRVTFFPHEISIFQHLLIISVK